MISLDHLGEEGNMSKPNDNCPYRKVEEEIREMLTGYLELPEEAKDSSPGAPRTSTTLLVL